MKTNTKRSIRNLVDLGLLFSKSDNQKWFFSAAKKVISNPRNPYNRLATRIISDIDNETVKKVGLNLGYSSLAYGANKLKKMQAFRNFSVPWILFLDICNPASFHQIKHLVKEGQELGIYSYIVCPHEKEDILAICDIANQFEECLFIFKVSAHLVEEQTAKALGKIHNAVVSVQAEDTGFDNESHAFQLLKQNRCLFGFHINYNEDNLKRITAQNYIRLAISLGSLFGVYIADNNVSEACRNAVYDFVCKTRGENGQPLITIEWSRDMQSINKKIMSDNGLLSGADYHIKIKEALANSLLETLKNMQPCTSS